MAEISVPALSLHDVRSRELVLGAAGVSGVATALYGASQVTVPVESDYGLVAVLPGIFWAGLVTMNLAMLAALRWGPVSRRLMALMQLGLCLTVYGAPALVTAAPRTEVAWRHLGIADALTGLGRVDPTIDAYFNWPGFFAGLGALLETTGVDPFDLALWAPVGNGVLWVLGVALVVRTLTSDERLLWLSLWLFTLTSWIDQDYLSSQAFAFFLYLVVTAVLLSLLAARPGVRLRDAVTGHGLVAGHRVWWTSRTPDEPSARLRVAGFVICTVLSLVIIASHQLTPFVVLAAVLALTLAGRTWSPGLVVVIGLALTLWLSTAASGYLAGHPVLFAGGADPTAQASVADRLTGSPGHVVVVRVRTVLALTCWGLAGLGFLKLWRGGVRDLRPALLFAAPFAMVPVHTYGGEVVLRAALFAAPLASYLAAALLLPAATGRGSGRAVLLAGLLAGLSVALVTARFGNARFDIFTDREIAAAERMYEMAPPDSTLIVAAHPTPWQYRDYVTLGQDIITEMCRPQQSAGSCYHRLRGRAWESGGGALVYVSRANLASIRMRGDGSMVRYAALQRRLASGGDSRLVFRNRDVRIYQFPPPSGMSERGRP